VAISAVRRRSDASATGRFAAPGAASATASCLLTANSDIKRPEDLAGKIMSVPEYSMTAALWLRGLFEDDYGSRPAAAQMGYLLEGIDRRAPQKTWRPELAAECGAAIEQPKRPTA
jgi:hypothetical protein